MSCTDEIIGKHSVKTLFWKRSASGLDSPAMVTNAFKSAQPQPRRQGSSARATALTWAVSREMRRW